MRNKFLAASAVLALLTSPAFAQETLTGTVAGAGIGAIVAGPPGALIGAAIGGTAGATSESARYHYSGEVRTGVVLPAEGVVYRDVPANYYVTTYKGPRTYKYAVIDDAGPTDRVVIVNPETRAVVQIL
jgi:hypothetical protein